MNAESPRPNFFIVGGPKCGTTALYTYLGSHPDIFMCRIKEPQFFAGDICGHQRCIRTLTEYLSCFAVARNQRRLGEASTVYLGSRSAANEIRTFSSNARIIIMLRNPVDVMYAQHSERVLSNMEHIRNFETALDSREPRRWRSGPFKNQEIIRLSYRELAHFAEQVQRYFDVFGRQNVHVVLYDEFKIDTCAVYTEVLRFLEVDCSHNDTDYPVINANRRARSIRVQELLRYPPKHLQGFARRALPRALRSATMKCLYRMNIVYQPRLPMDQALRRRLLKEYEPEVEQLSHLLGRDLSAWCKS
jgi:hypothetical protein